VVVKVPLKLFGYQHRIVKQHPCVALLYRINMATAAWANSVFLLFAALNFPTEKFTTAEFIRYPHYIIFLLIFNT